MLARSSERHSEGRRTRRDERCLRDVWLPRRVPRAARQAPCERGQAERQQQIRTMHAKVCARVGPRRKKIGGEQRRQEEVVGKGKQAPVDESSAQDRLFVPSVLAWKGEWKTFGRKAMTALVEYFPHMEDQSLLFILNELAEMKITVRGTSPRMPRARTRSRSAECNITMGVPSRTTTER